MAGKQHSTETRAVIGTASRQVWDAMTPEERMRQLAPMRAAQPTRPTGNTYSRTRSGKRADLGGLFVRSAWEANYARYLTWLVDHGEIAGWRYEPRTFEFPVKRGNRTYTPDFEVTTTDGRIEWHEVKGWMDDPSRVKLKRFARYYPDETLVLIDAAAYRALARTAAPLIKGWE
jgi:hypothetical protein